MAYFLLNKYTHCLCCLFLLASFLPCQDLFALENSAGATILIYHKFGEDKYPTTNVALDRFEEQMQFLQDNSYQVIALSDLVDNLKGQGGGALPEKTVVITIDDGYMSTYTAAWPILKKYGYPFTVFLYVKAVESKYRNFLTWAQIREMQAAGVDFQPHTYSHHRLGSWDPSLDEIGYRNWISMDLQKGSAVLKELFGIQSRYIALPYGEYNTIIIDEAQKLGFKAILTQDPGSISSSTDLFRIPREPILGTDWATIKHLKQVLERTDLPLADMYPGFEPFVKTTPDQFCASVQDVAKYQKGSFGVYVSELGWQPATVAANRACIDNKKTLIRRTNRVAFSARLKDSGGTAIHYWLLLNPYASAPAD